LRQISTKKLDNLTEIVFSFISEVTFLDLHL